MMHIIGVIIALLVVLLVGLPIIMALCGLLCGAAHVVLAVLGLPATLLSMALDRLPRRWRARVPAIGAVGVVVALILGGAVAYIVQTTHGGEAIGSADKHPDIQMVRTQVIYPE